MLFKTDNTVCENPFEHILYECLMYYGTCKLYFDLLEGSYSGDVFPSAIGLEPLVIRDIALESNLLHTRNLLEFFGKDRKPSEYDRLHYSSVLTNFTSNLQVTKGVGTIEAKMSEKISTMLLHPSTKRICNPKFNSTEIFEIASLLFPIIRAFWESVQRQDNFQHSFNWYDVAKRETKTKEVLDLYQAENCPPKEWMDLAKQNISLQKNCFNDISLTDTTSSHNAAFFAEAVSKPNRNSTQFEDILLNSEKGNI